MTGRANMMFVSSTISNSDIEEIFTGNMQFNENDYSFDNTLAMDNMLSSDSISSDNNDSNMDIVVPEMLPDGLTDQDLFSYMPQIQDLTQDTIKSIYWSSFEEADVALRLYAQRMHFTMRITHRTNFPGTKLLRYRVYSCNQSGMWKPKKVPDKSTQQNRKSQRIGCPWHKER